MIDRDRVSAYISEIKTAIDTLKAYSEIDKKAFLSTPSIIRDTKYSFIIAGQAAIDICYHLTAKLLKKVPKSYGNCFELLRELKAFPEDVLLKVSSMAKFRNVLVHHYIKVDNEQVYAKLKEIDVFERFCSELKRLMNRYEATKG